MQSRKTSYKRKKSRLRGLGLVGLGLTVSRSQFPFFSHLTCPFYPWLIITISRAFSSNPEHILPGCQLKGEQ